MPHLFRPQSQVKIVTKEGELEITLNINITIDGKVMATVDSESVAVETKQEEDKSQHFVPDFSSGLKLNFGKKE